LDLEVALVLFVVFISSFSVVVVVVAVAVVDFDVSSVEDVDFTAVMSPLAFMWFDVVVDFSIDFFRSSEVSL